MNFKKKVRDNNKLFKDLDSLKFLFVKLSVWEPLFCTINFKRSLWRRAQSVGYYALLMVHIVQCKEGPWNNDLCVSSCAPFTKSIYSFRGRDRSGPSCSVAILSRLPHVVPHIYEALLVKHWLFQEKFIEEQHI